VLVRAYEKAAIVLRMILVSIQDYRGVIFLDLLDRSVTRQELMTLRQVAC
jgi:hypothetical protein